MLSMIRSLFRHQAWADRAILDAARAHAGACQDEALRTTLHHMLVTQRFFLALFLGRAFDLEEELRAPASLDALAARFRETHCAEIAFVEEMDEGELSREREIPHLRVRRTTADCLVQVVMHSQHHRGQCASRLRALGAAPPATDFILSR